MKFGCIDNVTIDIFSINLSLLALNLINDVNTVAQWFTTHQIAASFFARLADSPNSDKRVLGCGGGQSRATVGARGSRLQPLRSAPAMARLAPLLPPLLAAVALLGAAPAAAGGDRTPDGRPLSLPTRARLHELTLDDLETTLDMLTDLLQERTLPSGGKGLVSRMAAPTLYADSALCRRHTQIYWKQFTTGTEALWPVLSKCPFVVRLLKVWLRRKCIAAIFFHRALNLERLEHRGTPFI